MNLQVIDHHTLDLDRLPNGALVLDVGAYGWGFASQLASRGCTVYALDPAPDCINPGIKGVVYLRVGLVGVGQGGIAHLVQVRDRDGWHLDLPQSPASGKATVTPVDTIDLPTLMAREKIHRWDAVKLNCEGAEIDILRTWPGPVATQLCVSFHEHTGALPAGALSAIQAHLGQWYDGVQHVREERYSAGWNWWDSLWLLR